MVINNGAVWPVLRCYNGICLEWGKPRVLESGSTIHGVDLDQASLLLGLQWMIHIFCCRWLLMVQLGCL